MKEFLKKDIVQRVVRTFIQGFCASLVVILNSTSNYDETLLKSALIGALAGGLSAIMNLIVNNLDNKESE